MGDLGFLSLLASASLLMVAHARASFLPARDPDYENMQASLQKWLQLPEQHTNLFGGLWSPDRAATLSAVQSTAQVGNAKAQCLLGLAYAYGWYGSATNNDEARRWLQKAADQDVPEAEVALGEFLLSNAGAEQNESKALALFQKATDGGSAMGRFFMGVCFHFGHGTPVDYEKARHCYELAGQDGFAPADCNLGMLYDSGLGVPRDPAKALALYRRSGAKNFPMALHNIAVSYARGDSVTQDFAEAAKWYRRAAILGYGPSQHNLGHAYLVGRGVPEDVQEGAKWLELAAEGGQIESLSVYSSLILEGNVPGDTKKALADMKRAADANEVYACATLGGMYAGFDPPNVNALVQQDDNKAAGLLLVAATGGNPYAQYGMGFLYLKGRGVPKDLVESFKWLTLAQNNGENGVSNTLVAVRANMSPHDLAEGLRRVREFKIPSAFAGPNPSHFLPGNSPVTPAQ